MRYGVLVGVSTGYPPVAGRLHTRYAPVRRSPAAHCCAPLPLDLHVLGLPLAFILSQDQTLHCKNCLYLLLPLTRLVSPAAASPQPSDTRYLIFPILFNVLSLPRRPSLAGCVSLSKAGAKIQPFSKPPKFFFAFFPDFSSNRCPSAVCRTNFFSFSRPGGPGAPRKTRKKSPFFRKIGTSVTKKSATSLQTAGSHHSCIIHAIGDITVSYYVSACCAGAECAGAAAKLPPPTLAAYPLPHPRLSGSSATLLPPSVV